MKTVFQTEDVVAVCALDQNTSAHFGCAFDGFPLFGSREAEGLAPVELDRCGGHVGSLASGQTDHNHTTEAFPNLPTCLVGVEAQNNFTTTATAGVGAQRTGEEGCNEVPRPEGEKDELPPGFDTAMRTLGVTSEALLEARNTAGDPNANPAEVAATLNLDEDALRAALRPPPRR